MNKLICLLFSTMTIQDAYSSHSIDLQCSFNNRKINRYSTIICNVTNISSKPLIFDYESLNFYNNPKKLSNTKYVETLEFLQNIKNREQFHTFHNFLNASIFVTSLYNFGSFALPMTSILTHDTKYNVGHFLINQKETFKIPYFVVLDDDINLIQSIYCENDTCIQNDLEFVPLEKRRRIHSIY